ncbi:heme peroxidase [Dichotomocladium elegans]|nr:heme peroxidase [Dichotomocladium elegans]
MLSQTTKPTKPSSKSLRVPNEPHKPFLSTLASDRDLRPLELMRDIKVSGGEHGLVKALHALSLSIKESHKPEGAKKQSVKDIIKCVFEKQENNSNPFEPSPSSQPTGAGWTFNALIKNLEEVTGLTPNNVKTVKEILALPLHQQRVVLGGIVETLLASRAPVNDRRNTFEAVMRILSSFGPEQDELIHSLVQPLIMTFHNDIHKPFINIVGNEYRSADGGGNSAWFPDAGRAGTNYSRTVTSTSYVNANLPAPKDVFEKLLMRREFTPHPQGVNALLLYLGTLITHDLFYTDPTNPMRNLTSSYFDLSVLYGFNSADQRTLRQMKGGLLKPDQWFDKRLVMQPPGVSALLVLFSRNHNYIAQTLLEKNENRQFSYGPNEYLSSAEEQDEKLFQVARLVNNGCFVNAIIHEYVRTILGTDPNSYFELNPLSTPSEPAYGNCVSIEFNIIYRWHAGIGEEDTEWMTKMMSSLGSKIRRPSGEVLTKEGGTDQSYLDGLIEGFNEAYSFGSAGDLGLGLPVANARRDPHTGRFDDKDLASALRRGYTQIASEIGNGRNIPPALQHTEIQGLLQSRKLKCGTLNDLRRHLNLTPLTSFEDYSNKPEVVAALKELYQDPDDVELFTGLLIERSKVTGLHLPYTMGRAILSDATNLLRNDRILSQQLTPINMTNWGYDYAMGKGQPGKRVLPFMLTHLLPDARANQEPVFSDEELKYLFTIPGRKPSN